MRRRSKAEIEELLGSARQGLEVPSKAKEPCDANDDVSVASVGMVKGPRKLKIPVSAIITVNGREGKIPVNSKGKGIDR